MFACEILAALLDKGKAMQVVQSLLPGGAAPLLPLASKVYPADQGYAEHITA